MDNRRGINVMMTGGTNVFGGINPSNCNFKE